MIGPDEDTPPAQRREGTRYRYSGLELLIAGPEGILPFPLCQESVRIGGPDSDIPLPDVTARLLFHADRLYFEDAAGRRPIQLGCEWHLGPYRLRVEEEEIPGAQLEGLSEPYLGRLWTIGKGPFLLGRPGKRGNHLCVQDCGLSREHARILSLPEGFLLQVESARSLTDLNGLSLKLGQKVLLREGDVLQLGEMRLRFRVHATTPGSRLYALGPFEVFTAQGRLDQSGWKHRLACHLLARVAAADGLLPVDRLLEDFWPDKEPAAARRRLTWHLCILRSQLGQEWVIRSHYGLKLKEGVWHDVVELERALRAGDVRSALQLYRGAYLDDCYLDWAQQLRHQLEARLVATLLAQLEGLTDPHLVLAACRALLERDPHCRPAYLESMRADLDLGMPERALRTFELARQRLDGELSIDLVRQQQRAKLLL